MALGVAVAAFLATATAYGDVGDGWKTVWGGFGRVGSSFQAGALTYRLRLRTTWRRGLPFWLPVAGLVFILAAPIDRSWFNAAAVLVLLSPLVYLGACSEIRAAAPIARVLSDTSCTQPTPCNSPVLVLADAFGQRLVRRLARADLPLSHPSALLAPLIVAAVFGAAL